MLDVRLSDVFDLRGSDTVPVTSFEGAIGVLLYGILRRSCTRGSERGVVNWLAGL